jgi:hypothetical protein
MTLQLGAALPFHGLEATEDLLQEEQGRAAWDNLITQLDTSVKQYALFQAQVKALEAAGIRTTSLQPRLVSWVDGVNKLFGFVADLIKKNSTVQSVIDSFAGAASTVMTAIGFGEVKIGAWREFVSFLEPKGASGLSGLWDGLAIFAVSALTNPAVWGYLKDILLKLGPWVGGVLVSENLVKTVNGDADATQARGELLATCLEIASKQGTAAEKQAAINACAKGGAPPENLWLWLGLGGAAMAGAIYYAQTKTKSSQTVSLSGLSRFSSRRRRR